MLNETETLAMLAALAQESRLRIVRLLLRSYPQGVPAGRIAEAVGCAPSTLSFHMGHLERTGLVRSQRRAQSILYAAVPEALGNLTAFLTEECCGGRPERCLPSPAVLAVPERGLPEPVPIDG